MSQSTGRILIWSAASLVMLGITVIIYSHWIEPAWVEVKTIRVPMGEMGREFDGLRLVQISDIHANHWMDEKRLSRIISKVNSLEPDIVAITGDFISRGAEPYADSLKKGLKNLHPSMASYAVLGNHDHWSDPELVRQILREAGVVELNNRSVTHQRGESVLTIAGLDDPWQNKADLEQVRRSLPPKGPVILLAHEPDFADSYAASGLFDLQLSGHSHGGQVRLPIWGPITTPKYSEKYPAGMYKIDEMLLYTNRGLGSIPFQIRFNSRPEITLFILSVDA